MREHDEWLRSVFPRVMQGESWEKLIDERQQELNQEITEIRRKSVRMNLRFRRIQAAIFGFQIGAFLAHPTWLGVVAVVFGAALVLNADYQVRRSKRRLEEDSNGDV